MVDHCKKRIKNDKSEAPNKDQKTGKVAVESLVDAGTGVGADTGGGVIGAATSLDEKATVMEAATTTTRKMQEIFFFMSMVLQEFISLFAIIWKKIVVGGVFI